MSECDEVGAHASSDPDGPPDGLDTEPPLSTGDVVQAVADFVDDLVEDRDVGEGDGD